MNRISTLLLAVISIGFIMTSTAQAILGDLSITNSDGKEITYEAALSTGVTTKGINQAIAHTPSYQ